MRPTCIGRHLRSLRFLAWLGCGLSFAADPSVRDLTPLIADLPAETGMPAVAVVLVQGGQVSGVGAAGVRRAGGSEAVTREDRWHLGSCTKSMTATLVGTLVEEGRITWDSTVAELLGSRLNMRPEYEKVTVTQLLSHRAGVPGRLPREVYEGIDYPVRVADLPERDRLAQRARFVEALLALPPSSEPGTTFEYSNGGYVIVGAMLEALTGKSWEALIQERLFNPLGMKSAGFGNAARPDRGAATQPWPHRDHRSPVSPGPGDDNSWVLGPAGTVHASAADVGRDMAFHATRPLGLVLKKAETFAYLHALQPGNAEYGRGWLLARTRWSRGPVLTHDGSNTMNHCSVWISPDGQCGVAAFTNSEENGGANCRAALARVVEATLLKPQP